MVRSALATLLLALTGASVEAQETWAFPTAPDRFSPEAMLDLSHLNEDIAGQTGFVRRSPDGADFVRGDGTPIRFWAVNSAVWRWAPDDLPEHARFLAKRGVNMVRFHGQVMQAGEEGGPIEAIDETQRDRLWRMVAAMKAEGIYTTFSPYYPHAVHREAAARWAAPIDSEGLSGLIYFDPVVQAAYKGWLRAVLTPENPHTGLPLKDDPALAIIQMQNEDSLLFWTLGQIKGREAHLLANRFGQFLGEKYGSLAAARAAWSGAKAPDPLDDMADDWDGGTIALAGIWHLTADAPVGQAAVRLSDQAEFLARLMHDWHVEVARYLKEDIGAPQLFNPGNWRTADDIVLDDLERWAYTSGDVVGVNRYVGSLHQGEHRGWAIVDGDIYRQAGILRRPLDLQVTVKQPIGHPYIIPETLWVPPMWQQAEGPLLTAAYQALTGVDVSYWFDTGQAQWRHPGSANGYLPSIGKWTFATPMQLGQFPAAALIFRQGLVDEAEPVVIERRSMADLWTRAKPLTANKQGYDPNRDSLFGRLGLSKRPEASPLSFLVGPVLAEFDSEAPSYIREDLDTFIDDDAGTVTSATGQLHWNWAKGLVTLNAPRAQGAIGDLDAGGAIALADVTLTGSNRYASVIAVPLDGAPLAQSARVLVQIGTIARPTGWSSRAVEHDGEAALQVTAFGAAPWRIERLDVTLTVRNPGLTRAYTVGPNGLRGQAVAVRAEEGKLSLSLPPDALYVILE